MIRRRNLRTRAIKLLVLDEADEMLNKGNNLSNRQNVLEITFLTCIFFIGFKEQIYDVYRYLPPATQASALCKSHEHVMFCI